MVAALALAGHVEPAAAQGAGDLSGQWQAGATAMDVSIESWGPHCGPRPRSSRSRGGGRVMIGRDGDALVLQSSGRVIRSDRCWSNNPSIRRTSGGRSGDTWVTRCSTPRDDPREEHGTYTLKLLAPGRLLYQDVSRFNWKLKDSTCAASITTVQTLMHSGTGPTTAAPPPLQDEAPDTGAQPTDRGPRRRTCSPGEPARISLRPATTRLALGGRTCVRPRMVDARGCPIPKAQQKIDWSLEAQPTAARAKLVGGCLQVGDNAAEAEGDYVIRARAGRLSARAEVTVGAGDLASVMARHLEVGGLGSADAGLLDAGGAGPGLEPAPPTTGTAARTLPRQSSGGGWAWTLLAALLAALAIGALVWVRRRAHVALRVPPAKGDATADDDGTGPAQPGQPTEAGGDHVCPTCRRGYPTAGRCRHDGTPLVPYAEFSRSGGEGGTPPRRRCPRCGTLYAPGSAFCGQDGSPLVDAD